MRQPLRPYCPKDDSPAHSAEVRAFRGSNQASHGSGAGTLTNRSLFSDNYAAARDRFCGAGQALGLRHERVPVDAATHDGRDLSIDVLFAGSERPSRMLIVTSGIHGVEGFFGSAIQVA